MIEGKGREEERETIDDRREGRCYREKGNRKVNTTDDRKEDNFTKMRQTRKKIEIVDSK